MGHVYLAPNSKNHLCYFYLVFLAHYSIILWIAFIYSSDVSTKLQQTKYGERRNGQDGNCVEVTSRGTPNLVLLPDILPGPWSLVPGTR